MKKDQRPPRADVDKLKNSNIKKFFQLDVKNRFRVLIDLHQFNTALLESSQQIEGLKRKPKEEWISEKTWLKISERKDKNKRFF